MSQEGIQDSLLTSIEEGDQFQEQENSNSNNSESESNTQNPAKYQCLAHCLVSTLLIAFIIGWTFELLYCFLVIILPKLITLLAIILLPTLIPLLTMALLLTRCLLFTISDDDGFHRAIQLKYFIHFVIFIAVLDLLIEMGILFPMVKYFSTLQDAIFLGLPLLNWVNITCMICGFYCMSYCVSLLVHGLMQQILYHKAKIVCSLYVREAVSEIINCLILLWAVSDVIVESVPNFKEHQLLGLQTWGWIKAAVFALVAHDCITLCTRLILRFLDGSLLALYQTQPKWYKTLRDLFPKQHLLYYVHGTRRSFSFVLTSLMLLLTWVLYFGSRLDPTAKNQSVMDLGTWSFLSLFLCSLLCLIKDCVLLAWEASTVYIRLYCEILANGKRLYFLGLLGRYKYDILNLRYVDKNEKYGKILGFIHHIIGSVGSHDMYMPSKDDPEDSGWGEMENDQPSMRKNMTKLSILKRNKVRFELFLPEDRVLNLHSIKQVAQYLLMARYVLSNDKYASEILDYLRENNPSGHDARGVRMDDLKKLIINNEEMGEAVQTSSSRASLKEEEKDWLVLEEMMKNVNTSIRKCSKLTSQDNVSRRNSRIANNTDGLSEEDKILAWMETTREICLFLANTINSGKEGVGCLNTVMNVAIIAVTSIVWLLLTGLASMPLFVALGSTIVTASFIFGESCKNLFEGIIFVYVASPFSVGDTCDIAEDKSLLVKAIGVWKTTFLKSNNSNEAEVIYPNSKLATQKIINHKIVVQPTWEGTETSPNAEQTPAVGTNHTPNLSLQES